MEKVAFESKGQKVFGTLFKPQNLQKLNPGVIFIHGFGSSEKNYLPLAQRLADKGIAAMTINLRGHLIGASENAKLYIKDGFEDGLRAYDFLANFDFIDTNRIGLCGASFGGGISAYISGERNVKSLVLRAPATYDTHLMELSLKGALSIQGSKFNDMENVEATIPIQNLAKFTGHLLVIESEDDVIIPHSMIQAFLNAPQNALDKKLAVLKNAEHDLSEDKREEFRSLVVDWFQKTL